MTPNEKIAALTGLGFTNASWTGNGDYVLQDDWDGPGSNLYIRAWLSPLPCPFPEMVREPYPVSPPE